MASENRLSLWITICFTFFRLFTFGGVMKVNGVMLQYTVDHLGTTNTLVAWAYTMQCAVSFMITPLGAKLLQYFTYRQLGVFGGFLSGFGFICSGLFVSQVLHLFICYALSGIGFGLICLPTFFYVRAHIDDKAYIVFSSATGLFSYTGVSVLPVVMGWMIESYGHKLSLVLIGVLLMNNVILGVTMRPTEQSKSEESYSPDSNVCYSELNFIDKYFFIFSALFRHANFAVLMLFSTVGMFVYSSWAIFLVSFGNDLQLSPQQSVYLSTAGGFGGIIGTIIPIVLLNKNKMNSFVGCFLPSLANGISLLMSVYTTNFYVVLCLMIVSGLSQGLQYAAICGFLPLLLCKYHFNKGLALSFFLEGILYQVGGLVAGALADAAGSTIIVFTVNGVVCLMVAPLALLWGCDRKHINECYPNHH